MPNIINQSLWGDEAFSAVLSMKSIPDLLATIARDTSPPLWNLFEWATFKLFGASEVSIRLLAFSFFLVAVFFAGKIAAHYWGKRTAFLAMILTFLNPFFFSYAFEGRMYSILAAGVTASMYFFITRQWFLYVVASLFALYSHHFAIFALFVQAIWFLYEIVFGNKNVAKKMFLAFVAIGIGYTAWLIPLYNQTKMVGGGFWLGKPSPADLKNLFFDYLGEGIKHPYSRFVRILVLIALALRIWTKDIKKSLFLISWFTLPILVTWFASQKFTPIFFNRYLLYTIPAAMILLASNRRKFANIIIFIAITVFALIDLNYFIHPSKIPFRDLASFVKNTRGESSYLINADVGNHKLWESKFYGIPATIFNPSGNPLPFFIGTALMEKDDIITNLPKNVKRLGVITYQKGTEVKLKGYKVVEEKSFGPLNFVWMEKSK